MILLWDASSLATVNYGRIKMRFKVKVLYLRFNFQHCLHGSSYLDFQNEMTLYLRASLSRTLECFCRHKNQNEVLDSINQSDSQGKEVVSCSLKGHKMQSLTLVRTGSVLGHTFVCWVFHRHLCLGCTVDADRHAVIEALSGPWDDVALT